MYTSYYMSLSISLGSVAPPPAPRLARSPDEARFGFPRAGLFSHANQLRGMVAIVNMARASRIEFPGKCDRDESPRTSGLTARSGSRLRLPGTPSRQPGQASAHSRSSSSRPRRCSPISYNGRRLVVTQLRPFTRKADQPALRTSSPTSSSTTRRSGPCSRTRDSCSEQLRRVSGGRSRTSVLDSAARPGRREDCDHPRADARGIRGRRTVDLQRPRTPATCLSPLPRSCLRKRSIRGLSRWRLEP